jgi:acyl dehydratase
VGVHALSGSSGRHYAFLSGDFNPIHWITPAAKAAGFRSCILHGCVRPAQSHTFPILAHLNCYLSVTYTTP